MKQLKEFYNKYMNNIVVGAGVLALLLNLIIESSARHSLFEGCKFFALHPLVFIYNSMIIFVTLIIAFLVRRRIFTFFIISAVWLVIGVVNGVILSKRMTPFTTKDLSVMKDGLSLATNYLSDNQLIIIGVASVAILILFILMFKFAPKKQERINYKKTLILIFAIWIGFAGVSKVAVKTNVVGTFFGNLAYAYRDYGVPYCFLNTWLNTGVKRPWGYSKKMIEKIFTDEQRDNGKFFVEKEVKDDGIEHPNIIYLQMESFIDPYTVKGFKYSKDPIPHFRKYSEEFPSGCIQVPSVGAGTANTEFEMLSGMSVKFFGPGEYPYKSILTKKTCDSIAYDLKKIGYGAHAIHNHRGVFYGRNKVFANLGFDTFTSLEYMNHVVKTPGNWAKDYVLTEQIFDALNATESEDFIYACSVQGHGKYPTEQKIENPEIVVTEAPTEEKKWQYEYYVNQLYEMDDFIHILLEKLKKRDEKTIVVVYGDHLPALNMKKEDMTTDSLFKTEYFIWSNFPMENEKDGDIYSYQMTARIQNILGLHEGFMTKYHQNYQNTKNYKKNMKALQYDFLYGKNYLFNQQDVFEPTRLQMGIKPIKINEIVQIGKDVYIKGENFTVFSKVSLDGKILKTIFLGSSVLGLQTEVKPEDVSRMKVSQVEKHKEILSTTE